MKNTLIFILVLVMTGAVQAGQQPDRRRPPHGGMRPPPERMTPEERERREKEWQAFRKSLTKEERRAFSRMKPRERRRFIRERQKELRKKAQARKERAFLSSLDEKTRAELEALPAQDRSKAILGIRLDRKLKKMLVEAADRKLLAEGEADKLLAEKDLNKKALQALQLQKKIFVATFGDAIAALPERRRTHLTGLSPREFFRHPEIKRLPVIHFFDMRRARRMMREDPQFRGRLREALEKGQLSQAVRRILRKGRLAELEKLGAPERKKLLRQVPLFRPKRPRGEGRPPRGRRPGQFSH